MQAIDELERWEEARVLYRDVDLDEFRVNFTEWENGSTLQGGRNRLGIHLDHNYTSLLFWNT